VVVGSGVAGLRAAIQAASAGLRVVILAKDPASDSNTDKAQGGIAVALSDEDRVGLHYQDTVAAGAGLCDERAVRTMVEEGPGFINELIGWGAAFDRDGTRLSFTREGAHSARRVLHARGDSTGQEILRALLLRAHSLAGLSFLPGVYTVDLLTEGGMCVGVRCLETETGSVAEVHARILLATGGCGQVYRETTNPSQATGDGIAMAYRAGAWVRDMEFVQFHPTALALPGAPRFLLSEALRGEGGVLRDAAGYRFMPDVDPRLAELAPRDVVARAIAARMESTGTPHVYLDMTALDGDYLKERFPRIHSTCLSYGLEISRDPIPVSPSAHYMMGGVASDHRGRTSIPGLYAAGEVACTGVHGANRLASNSLLEGLVFGARAGMAVVSDAGSDPVPFQPEPERPDDLSREPLGLAGGPKWVRAEAAESLTGEVRGIAWTKAGLIRDASGLHEALEDLAGLMEGQGGGAESRSGVEGRNLRLVASLIARAALERRESRGAHCRTDYPGKDDEVLRRSHLMKDDAGFSAVRMRAGSGSGPT
jgi:L-aspartate oxidase